MAVYTTIDDAGSFFNTLLWTGNSPSTQALTGVGFQPDFVWVKKRSSAAAHCLTDSVRGATETIFTDVTTAETTRADGLTAFGADGFTVGADGDFNGGSATFVGWNWKAGTTSGLTGGTITPGAYSFNTTSGISIIQYDGNSTSGATVPHGLGAAPTMVWVKNLDSGDDWAVGFDSLGWTKYLKFNDDGGSSTTSVIWNDTAPSTTVVTLGDNAIVNTATTRGYIMYAFAPIKGYSAFGSYSSNAAESDGPFIYTGFRPAYTMIKESGGSNPWVVDDVTRETTNEMGKPLKPNNTDGTYAGSAYGIDFLSNGFKIRNGDSTYNGTSNDFIYAAFAEAPLVNSSGVPVNAR